MLRLFKNGFTAIIAIIAISMTIAAQAGAFNGTTIAAAPAGCYLPDDVITKPATPSHTTESSVPVPQNPVPCTNIANGAIPVGDPLNDCARPPYPVCCYEVAEESCSGQTNRVVAIFFGEL